MRKTFLLLILFLIALLIPLSVRAGDVKLEWDASPDENTETFAGYRMWVGVASGVYNTFYNTGKVLAYTVKNLPEQVHYFAVTAYDLDGNESDYSNEVFAFATNTEPFVITSLAVSMRWFGVVLLATTSENSSAILRYTNLETGEKQTVIATQGAIKTQHRVVLYLNMGQTNYYRYEWTVTDSSGMVVTDGATFQTR